MHHGIHIEHLSKRYGQGDTAVLALKDVNMHVAPGEVVGLIGPSGSGKSTLLKCLGAVIDPTSGRMTLGDEVILTTTAGKCATCGPCAATRLASCFKRPT